MDEEALLSQLRESCNVAATVKDSPRNSWRIWSYAVIDAARFLVAFDDVDGFLSFVNHFQYNTATKVALPLYLAAKIRGLGFALACDALKELGCQGYAKPDRHMIDIFSELGFCNKAPVDVFETMLEMSDALSISPFELDKTLWLVCSGKFYLDEKRAKNGKAVLISRVKDALGSC